VPQLQLHLYLFRSFFVLAKRLVVVVSYIILLWIKD